MPPPHNYPASPPRYCGASARFASSARHRAHQIAAADGFSEPQCGGEGHRVGRAVAFDHRAVQTEKHAAIDPPRVHPPLERAERWPSRQGGQFAPPPAAKRVAGVVGDQARRALCGFERHIARKTVRYDHVHIRGWKCDRLQQSRQTARRARLCRSYASAAAPPLGDQRDLAILNTHIQQTNARSVGV